MSNITRNYMQIVITRKIHKWEIKVLQTYMEITFKRMNVDKFTIFVCCDIDNDTENFSIDECETWTAY
jgi:hypothetical protein